MNPVPHRPAGVESSIGLTQADWATHAEMTKSFPGSKRSKRNCVQPCCLLCSYIHVIAQEYLIE